MQSKDQRKEKKYSERLDFLVSEKMKRDLERLSYDMRTPQSAIVRSAISNYVRSYDRKIHE